MDDEELTRIRNRVLADEWPTTLAAPRVLRVKSDTRATRRTAALALVAALAVPAIAVGVTTFSDSDSPAPQAPVAQPEPVAPSTARSSAPAAPSAEHSSAPFRAAPVMPGSSSPAPASRSELTAPPGETLPPKPDPPAPSSTPTLINNSPADLALATRLLETQDLPDGFIALPSCCHFGGPPPSVPPGANRCDHLPEVPPAAGRTASAERPIRSTEPSPTKPTVSLIARLAMYDSVEAARDAVRVHGGYLKECTTQTVEESDYSAKATLISVAAADVGDESLVSVEDLQTTRPERRSQTLSVMLTRSGSTVQMISLTRPLEVGGRDEFRAADLALLHDFARRGVAKIRQ